LYKWRILLLSSVVIIAIVCRLIYGISGIFVGRLISVYVAVVVCGELVTVILEIAVVEIGLA
jgi:hypothetical protein